jgi:hypothetical protein
MLPNLKNLELMIGLEGVDPKWDFKSTKIERIMLSGSNGFSSFLESLEKPVIKELELHRWSQGSSVAMSKFLKSQQKSLKKLTVRECNLNFLDNLKDLRLEQLEIVESASNIVSLEFLKDQVDLRVLRLNFEVFQWERGLIVSDRDLNAIWELKNLETLDLQVSFGNGSSLNNVHKLKKLKRLRVHGDILQHLQFGVFDNLEELEASFRIGSCPGNEANRSKSEKSRYFWCKSLGHYKCVTGKFGKLGIHQN